MEENSQNCQNEKVRFDSYRFYEYDGTRLFIPGDKKAILDHRTEYLNPDNQDSQQSILSLYGPDEYVLEQSAAYLSQKMNLDFGSILLKSRHIMSSQTLSNIISPSYQNKA